MFVTALSLLLALASAQDSQRPLHLDVAYQPTPPAVVEAMLEFAHVQGGDVLYDLGSGDGRIPIAAAKRYGIRAVGVELDPDLVHEARQNARSQGVSHLVEFRQEDLFKVSLADATVVTLYLGSELNARLRPRLLRELRPGTRIVSHRFDMAGWPPEKTREVSGRSIYLWTVRPH